MEVGKIQQNYTAPRRNLKKEATPNFTGAASLGKQITNSLSGKNAIERMKKLEWLKGEIGGILITALGTGLVAPIFIGFNPFVKAPKDATKEQKEDVKNTKLYTAMRQPISAVLAILFQVSALKPIDKFLDNLFNKEQYAKHFNLHVDQSAINSKSYVKSLVKEEFKQQGKTKPSYFQVFTKGWSKVKEEREAYDNLFDTRIKAIQDEQLDKVANVFRETGAIKVGQRTLDNKTVAELINTQIDDYVSDATKLKIDNDGLAFYSKRAKTLVENEEHLREIFKNPPSDSKQLQTYLQNLHNAEQSPEVKEILKEIIDRPEDIRRSRIDRTLKRIDNIKSMCKGNYSHDNYLDAMSLRNAELDRTITRLKLSKIAEPDKATNATITETIKRMTKGCQFEDSDTLLRSILHDTDTFDFNADKLSKKIHKDITKLYKKLVENKYKSFNQISKILIGVCITLPITCNALNWVYPRFMELFFPKLAGVKKDGGDK